MRYMRVKDKQTKHRYDVLIQQFDPEKHEPITKGPYSGESQYSRRPQLFVPRKRGGKSSGKPSGDDKQESED